MDGEPMKPLVLLVDGPFRTGHRRLNCYSHDVVTQTRHHINYVPRYYRNCKPFRKKKKKIKFQQPFALQTLQAEHNHIRILTPVSYIKQQDTEGDLLISLFLSSQPIQQLFYDDNDYDDHYHHYEKEDRLTALL